MASMAESQRFARLQHLLEKSSIYSKILLKKMEDQREENKKMAAKKNSKHVRKRKGPNQLTSSETSKTPKTEVCLELF